MLRLDLFKTSALFLIAAAVGVSMAGASRQVDAPWFGLSLHPGGAVVETVLPGGPAARAGVLPGDTLVRIEARGERGVILEEREGLTFHLEASRPPLGLLISRTLPVALVGLFWLGVAVWLVLRRTQDAAGRLLIITLVLIGTTWLLQAPKVLRDLWGTDPLLVQLEPAIGVGRVFGAAVLVYCAALISRPRRTLFEVLPWLAVGCLAATAALLLQTAAWLDLPLLLFPVGGLVALLVARHRGQGFDRRLRLGWLCFGAICAALPTVLLVIASGLALPLTSRLGIPALALASLPFPVAAAFASRNRRGLVSLDVVVGRTLGALLLLVPLIGLVAALAWALRDLPMSSAWLLTGVAGGVLAVGAWLLAGRLGPQLERGLFDRRHRAQAALDALTEELADGEALAPAFNRLSARLTQILDISASRFLLHEGDGKLRVCPDHAGYLPTSEIHRLPHHGRVMNLLRSGQGPVLGEDLELGTLRGSERAFLKAVGWARHDGRPTTAMLVPFGFTARLLGVLQLGHRRDGRPLEAPIFRLLDDFASRLGVPIGLLASRRLAQARHQLGREAHALERQLAIELVSEEVERGVAPALRALYYRQSAPDAIAGLEHLLAQLSEFQLPASHDRMAVDELLDEALLVLQNDLEETSLSFDLRRPDGDLGTIAGDRSQLRLLLVLVLRHAVTAMPPGTRTGLLSFTVAASEDEISFTAHGFDPWGPTPAPGVADTGPVSDRPFVLSGGLAMLKQAERIAHRHGGTLTSQTNGQEVLTEVLIPR